MKGVKGGGVLINNIHVPRALDLIAELRRNVVSSSHMSVLTSPSVAATTLTNIRHFTFSLAQIAAAHWFLSPLTAVSHFSETSRGSIHSSTPPINMDCYRRRRRPRTSKRESHARSPTLTLFPIFCRPVRKTT